MKKLILIFCCIFAPLTARAETYDCTLKAHSRWGWIPPRLIIILGEGTAQALVYDVFVHQTYGEPIPAALQQRSESIFVLTWDVRDMEISNLTNTITGQFRANLNKKTNKITMRVFLNGADILPRGSGTCELQK